MNLLNGHEAERQELEVLLKSEIFARAPSLASFLVYVSEKYFAGETDRIKEYNIAVEALGRPADFNQKQDSVVRVEAHRLRKRLKEYYEREGAGHAVQISLPPGQYVPQFIRRFEPDSETAAGPVEMAPRFSLEDAESPAAISSGPRHFRPRWSSLAVGSALMAGCLVLLVYGGKPWFFFAPSQREHPSISQGALGIPEGDEVRILAGSSVPRYIDHLGNIWGPDRYFRGGAVLATPNHPISRTRDPQIFQFRREGGDFSYDIPLKRGLYELHVYFAETVFGENNVAGGGETSRLFRVFANEQSLIDEMDVVSDAGGSNIADERVFRDISPAPDGFLHLRFRLIKESAILNAIALVPQLGRACQPVRILARDARYTDGAGAVWLPDRYYDGGQTVLRNERVAGTKDPDLYRGERYGHFRYTIPVATGRYTVRLNFAETWFGPGRAAGGGVDSRIFDVYLNGVALLRNFDIFRAAGGPNRAVEKYFHGIAPNAQGKIVLSFVPVKNYACINSIEVRDELQ